MGKYSLIPDNAREILDLDGIRLIASLVCLDERATPKFGPVTWGLLPSRTMCSALWNIFSASDLGSPLLIARLRA